MSFREREGKGRRLERYPGNVKGARLYRLVKRFRTGRGDLAAQMLLLQPVLLANDLRFVSTEHLKAKVETWRRNHCCECGRNKSDSQRPPPERWRFWECEVCHRPVCEGCVTTESRWGRKIDPDDLAVCIECPLPVER